MSEKENKICFVIAPIGEEGSDIRHRSDQILKYIIEPVMKECDYVPIRADKIADPGLITSQIIQHLIDDSLVIADLTGRNPNVYYELAIRHTIKKPFIQIIESDETIPFDIAGIRTISVEHKDLDSVHYCKEKLINQIHSIERNPNNIETPISFAVDQQSLRQSDNPLESSNAEIISMLQEVKNMIRDLKNLNNDIINNFEIKKSYHMNLENKNWDKEFIKILEEHSKEEDVFKDKY